MIQIQHLLSGFLHLLSEFLHLLVGFLTPLSGFLTPLIAIVTVFIYFQQWKLAKQKWRLELYDKRFETYRYVVEFISLICREGDCPMQKRGDFLRTASRTEFLFGPEIQQFIEELHKQARKKSDLDLYVQGQSAERAGEIACWFLEQFDVAKKTLANI